jgi:biotin carboxyl carrier protein
MKMQNQIVMPFDGKIKKVYVKPDEKIRKNHLMIELA